MAHDENIEFYQRELAFEHGLRLKFADMVSNERRELEAAHRRIRDLELRIEQLEKVK